MMRRFWKTVAIDNKADGSLAFALVITKIRINFMLGNYGVLLDKRTLRTPGGAPLILSHKQLPVIILIAEEWENQVAVLKPHTLPMVTTDSIHHSLSKY